MNDEKIRKLFAESLKELRGHESQRRTASRVRVDRSTLARYESDEGNPSLSKLWKLADFFNVTIDKLVGRKHGRNRET